MTHITSKKIVRRGRIFPELTISPEELARREAEDEIFYQRCRAIFDRVRPQYIKSHYGWYISIEPNSGEEMLRTAKGESEFQIYLGQVILDGKQYQIPGR